ASLARTSISGPTRAYVSYAFDTTVVTEKFSIRCHNPLNVGVWGQKCREVSTVRGRRLGGARGAGGTGAGGWACTASRSHRAQGGLCVRPANGLGSVERWRLDLPGTDGGTRRAWTR